MLINGSELQSAGAVTGAIRNAARATGASFQYLLATAQVESGLNPNATAARSSAAGLYQFIDQTWLGTMKQAGPSLGYGRYADAIVVTAAGRYEVPDPAARRAIMALRQDPAANAAMAGAFTRANAAQLSRRIGRNPTDGELYIAHFLGPGGASRLVNLTVNRPNMAAAEVFPNAARANPSIFYAKDGRARTLAEVYNGLVGRYERALNAPAVRTALGDGVTPSQRVAEVAAFDPAIYASRQTPDPKPIFQSLFRSDEPPRAVSRFVEDLWISRPRVAAALTAQPATITSAPLAAPTALKRAETDSALDLFAERPTNAQALFTGRS
jgi:hypothetical protein